MLENVFAEYFNVLGIRYGEVKEDFNQKIKLITEQKIVPRCTKLCALGWIVFLAVAGLERCSVFRWVRKKMTYLFTGEQVY